MQRIAVTLLALGIVGARAEAQIGMSPVQDYINKTTLLNNILSNSRATGMSQRAQTGAASGNRAGAGNAAATTSLSAFKHSGSSILPSALAERASNGSVDKRTAQQFFESQLDLYKKTAATDGFPPNEVAYALEYFIVNTYMTYHDLHDVPYEKDPRVKRGKDSFDRITIINEKKTLKPTMLQERAVFGQMQSVLAANPALAKMTDHDKQELTELLAIMMGVNLATYLRGVNAADDRLIAQARQSARENLERLLGAPIDRIKIDERGVH